MPFALDPNFQLYTKSKLQGFKPQSIGAVLDLSSSGCTVPFISRYRKEQTGNLDEVQVRSIIDAFEQWQELTKRKAFVLEEMNKQGVLTSDLKLQIQNSKDLYEIEELYKPFKRKKKTKAQLAREAGLEPLANWIWQQGQGEIKDTTSVEIKAKEYINPKMGYVTYEEVLTGAQHILVEKLAQNQELRQAAKDEVSHHGIIQSKKTTKFKTNSKYEMYAEFSGSVKSLLSKKASHRYLALRRGWQEGELKISLEVNEDKLLKPFEAAALKTEGHQLENQPLAQILKQSAQIAMKTYVLPSVINEQHSRLKESADEFAIDVFSENVRKVLMSGPFGSHVVLGVDPGLRTGCKLALVDNRGQFISSTVMHILGDKAKERAKKLFGETFKQLKIEAIAVGNGTGGRETEKFIREVLKEIEKETHVIMVSESGASVYSASDTAREEFPNIDLTVRGAISIARRLQDPLAELVKVDPKSIGVGQYQHDVSQSRLKKSLNYVVASCVNQVGVEINTASTSLLQYVSGIGPSLAKAIVEHRQKNGLFKERGELMKIPRFSSKVFEQSAGFLRVSGGSVLLDQTGIHPERYMAVKEMAKDIGVPLSELIKENSLLEIEKKRDKWVQLVGEYTFNDILSELRKPGRDPRNPYKVFSFREDIHELKDIKVDMLCPGIITNVTNFGAFVDIGVHQDGLVHISELSHDFVEDPRLVVSPGDQVQVKVIRLEVEKKQIFLTMRLKEKPKAKPKTKGLPTKSRANKSNSSKSRPNKMHSRKLASKEEASKQGGKKGGKKAASKKRYSKSTKPPRNGKPSRRPQPFNNPFAALTKIKQK